MRILHILNHVKRSGNGIVDATVDLASEQARFGHDVAVASAGGDFVTYLAERGVRHYFLNQQRPHRRFLDIIRCFVSVVDEFKPDIVHAQMRTAVVVARVVAFSRRYRIVSSVHSLKLRLEILMALADRTIAVSNGVAMALRSVGLPSSRIVVVQNGTLGSARDDGTKAPLNIKRPAITAVAGMYHHKGVGDLISAFDIIGSRYPEAHLYLVGDGPDRAAFERQAQATSDADRIHFEGFQLAPKRWLRETDVFVMPSRMEASGLALIDARDAGCAIVATNVGGIPEVLDGGAAGVLTPVNDAPALAAAIAALLSDPSRRRALRTAALQDLERFSVQRVARETLAVYATALEPRSKETTDEVRGTRESH